MNRGIRLLAIMAVTCVMAVAAETTMRHLLPMEAMLRHLAENDANVVLMPLAEYKGIVERLAVETPDNGAPRGIWLQSAQHDLALHDGGQALLAVTVQAVALAAKQPTWCPLMAWPEGAQVLAASRADDALAVAERDGQIAVLLDGSGPMTIDLLLRLPLRSSRLKAGEPAWITVFDPVSAAMRSVTISSQTGGQVNGPGVHQLAGGRWQVMPVTDRVHLRWGADSSAAADTAVWGLRQELTIDCRGGERRFRWRATPIVSHGAVPDRVELQLPESWRVASLTGLEADGDLTGRLHLRVRDRQRWELTGQLPDLSSVDLFAVSGATWGGGTVRIVCDPGAVLDGRIGDGWLSATDADADRWQVLAPGQGASFTVVPTVDDQHDQRRSYLLCDDERWVWHQHLELTAGDHPVFEAGMRLPAGWRLTAMQANRAIDAPVLRDALDFGQALPADCTIHLPAGMPAGQSLTMTLVCERPAPTEAIAIQAAGFIDTQVDRSWIAITCAPWLQLDLTAGDGWYAALIDNPWADLRQQQAAVLAAADTATPLQVATVLRPRSGQLESVAFVLPDAQTAHCRLELRGQLRQGRVDQLRLRLPFDPAAAVTIDGIEAEGSWADDGSYLLRFARPWEGELRCRLTGQLASAEQPPLLASDDYLAVRQTVVYQLSAVDELRLEPGAAAEVIDIDAVPTWATPWPGPRLVAAMQVRGADVGRVITHRHQILASPDGFVDDVQIRWRIASDAQRMVYQARVAAPGVQHLPLTVPDGWEVVGVRVDGRSADLRLTDGGLELPIDASHQQSVQLLLAGPAPGSRLDMELPRLGSLPVLACTISGATSGSLELRPSTAAGCVVLRRLGPPRPVRPLYGRRPFEPIVDIAMMPTDDDPRFHLQLDGRPFTASARGGALRVQAGIVDHANDLIIDGLGWLGGFVLGLLCLASRWPLRLGLFAAAAVQLGLCAWLGTSFGPLQALAEVLLPVMLVSPLLRRPRAQLVTALLLLVPLVQVSAADVWMGYRSLDAQGRPVGVQVAVPQEQLLQWMQTLRGESPQEPACDVAVGAWSVAITAVAEDHMDLRCSLPVVVCSDRLAWLGFTAPSGSREPARWQAVGGPSPVFSALGDQRQGLRLLAGLRGTITWVCRVPRAPGVAWEADLMLPALVTIDHDGAQAPLTPAAGSLALADAAWQPVGSGWIPAVQPRLPLTDLQLDGSQPLRVQIEPKRAVRSAESDLRIHQDVLVTMDADHLRWRAMVVVSSRAFSVPRCIIDLPPGLRVTDVEAVQSWQQDQDRLTLVFAADGREQRVQLSGVLPVSVAGRQSVLVDLPRAARSTGSLSLAHGERWRLRLAPGVTAQRADRRVDADLTYAWQQRADLSVIIDREAVPLEGDLHVAVVCGRDGWRATAELRLANASRVEQVNLHLPAGWRLADHGAGIRVVSSDAGTTLHRHGGFSADRPIVVSLRGDRPPLVEQALLQAPGLRLVSEAWLVGQAAPMAVRLDTTGHHALAPEQALRGFSSAPQLRAGERWQMAYRRAADLARPVPEQSTTAARIRVDAHHYLVLDGDELRWHVRLNHVPESGAIDAIDLRWAGGWRLVDWRCSQAGRWQLDGDRVQMTPGTALTQPVVVDLVFTAALHDAVTLTTPLLDDGRRWGAQYLAVAYDRSDVLQLQPDGLRALQRVDRAMHLPEGVDGRALPAAFVAERPQWTLQLRREQIGRQQGVDGVARLVDVQIQLADDGALRGRATWAILNRSRQRLALSMPPGTRLWECRVDQRLLRPQQVAGDERLWIPVSPMRIGDAATRISYSWEQAADRQRVDGSPFAIEIPRIDAIDVQVATWRVHAPDGRNLVWESGSLREEEPTMIIDMQAQGVIEELRRLRSELNQDRALVDDRLEVSIGVLESELADYLRGPVDQGQVPQTAKQVELQQAFNSLNMQVQDGIKGNRSGREQRRKVLQLDNEELLWTPAAPIAQGPLPRTERPVDVPWSSRGRLLGGTLDEGRLPAGYLDRRRTPVLGMDLLDGTETALLHLSELGGLMRVTLRCEADTARDGTVHWAWALLSLLPLLLTLGWRRRAQA